jgi:alpha-amylase
MSRGLMMQFFHWYIKPDGSLYSEVSENAEKLSMMGVTAVWLPPACKGEGGGYASGYDIYDLFDLGEFDQKGSVRTKFGTKQQYAEAVDSLHKNGMQVYADIVLNHKAGADDKELIQIRKVNPDNRNEFISELFDIMAFTKFTFPGRKNKYSDFIWDHRCFSGVDYDDNTKETAIYSILNEYGHDWEDVVDTEKGNYDYLMYADIEFRNPAVREELKKWGKWYLEQIPFDGVRLDAVKHMSPRFYNEWLDDMRAIKPDLFAVGEYWTPGELRLLLKYIEVTNGRMSLFDAPLHHNFHVASRSGRDFDMTTIFDNSLVKAIPELAVTVVDNHDTQPLQSLDAPVESWFKPLAYSLILLREAGYPCIFYPDLYGTHYTGKGHDGNDQEIFLAPCENLDKLIHARNRYASGKQNDYFDHANCIGWTREGDIHEKDSGCAVLLSNGDTGFKRMMMGNHHGGQTFIDLLGKFPGEVRLDDEGCGEFHVSAGSVSVWVNKETLKNSNPG